MTTRSRAGAALGVGAITVLALSIGACSSGGGSSAPGGSSTIGTAGTATVGTATVGSAPTTSRPVGTTPEGTVPGAEPDAIEAAARAAVEQPGVVVHRVVVEGRRAVLHIEVTPAAGGAARAVAEVIEIGPDGRAVAERVTVSQPVGTTPSVNGHTLFDGPVGAPKTSEADANRAVVERLYAEAFVGGDESVVDELVAPDYAQHNPVVPNGSAALKALVANTLPVEVVSLVAQGDLVAAHVRYGAVAAVDIFRLEDGRIVEHWDVLDRP